MKKELAISFHVGRGATLPLKQLGFKILPTTEELITGN